MAINIRNTDTTQMYREERHSQTDWNQINWKKVHRRVQNLRFRIFRETKEQNWSKVRNLIRLLLKSYSNLLLSIRHVTQQSDGRKTPGVDGELITTPGEREKLADELQKNGYWRASPVKRVYIPKSNGKMRPLGIPTIRDRVMQAVVKNALEPRFEAESEAQSYGFRPGRCCQDAIDEIYVALNECATGRNQYILDADIKGAFDHISHDFILKRIDNMPGQNLVKQWLKAGYVEWGKLHQSTEGTPQGGVASPLLANIALDGLQKLLGKGYRIARYADDFVIMTKNREATLQAIPEIVDWLKERGLKLNWEKTRIVHRTEGFNFLGFKIRMYGNKLLIKPQKEKVLGMLRKVKSWLNRIKRPQPRQ